MGAPATVETSRESASSRVSRQAAALSAHLRAVGERFFPPSASKSLRSFSSGEVAQIIGVSDGYLRQLSLDGLGPAPDVGTNGRLHLQLREGPEVEVSRRQAQLFRRRTVP